jgi:hypothetical protein
MAVAFSLIFIGIRVFYSLAALCTQSLGISQLRRTLRLDSHKDTHKRRNYLRQKS